MDRQYVEVKDINQLLKGDLIYSSRLQTRKVCFFEVLSINDNDIRALLMMVEGIAVTPQNRYEVILTQENLINYSFKVIHPRFTTYEKELWPKNLEDAIKIMASWFTNEETYGVLNSTYNYFIGSVGQKLRNDFGLWNGNFELLLNIDPINPEADNVSEIIMKIFYTNRYEDLST